MGLVLLIDDEPQMAKLVEMTLEGGPEVEIVLATNLSEAIAAARRRPPEVVLLDLALRDEDGLAILPRLRAEPNLAGVPVIVFTVHDSRREEALRLGVEGFVAKPFKAADLIEVVEPFLGGDRR